MKHRNQIQPLHRALLAISGVALLTVILLPIWKIELIAPQYPEGLELLIHSYKLSGQVDIINGLNHYIGMKVLNADDFIEFKVLPYLIGIYGLTFILVSFFAKRKGLYLLMGAFLLFGVVAMVDFYIWLYDYGHDLDPTAPIKVPGMAYQPPLIGYKELLNFLAFSIPAVGGWIFIGCGMILAYCTFFEWKLSKKRK